MLTERQKNILYLMVKAHIMNGEPMGSKTISELLQNKVSSATIRNEMSFLSEMGFLEQPHTSAGRIPTSKAYRMYVNGLLSNEADEKTKRLIDERLSLIRGDFEGINETATKALSEITGLPSVSLISHEDTTYIKRIEILPMGKRTVLIVLVTSDTLAKSRMCKSGFDLTADLISRFDRIASKEIVGTELSRFNASYMQKIASLSGEIALIPFFNTVFDMINDLKTMQLSLKGENTILEAESQDAIKLMEFISRRDAIISVLADASDPISIVLGEGNENEKSNTSLVIAKHSGGKIGVIGPKRMSYENDIPSIAYFAQKLGDIINKAINDME